MSVRRVANILNLSTVLGLVVAALGRARVRRGPHGLLLAEDGLRLRALAIEDGVDRLLHVVQRGVGRMNFA